MLRFIRWTVGLAVAVIVGTLFGATLGAVGPAGATTPSKPAPDCRSVSTTVNRPDHGHGTVNGGYWANMKLTRVTTFCLVPAPQRAAAEAEADVKVTEVVPPAKALYLVKVVETGTLTTIAGAALSPNDAKPLAGNVPGAVSGGWVQLLVADAGWLGYQGRHDGATLSGQTWTDNKGAWAADVWGGEDAKVFPIKHYGWTYQTCVSKIVKSGYTEQWIDTSGKDNDGTADSAGDIVGKACPAPSPSASVSAGPSAPAVSTSPSAPAGLPVTGTNVWYVIGTGAALVAVGAVLFGLARRRRGTEFTA